MVTTIIFFLVLTVLVFVHEMGHFLVARFFGIRVDDFAIGFPPRIWSFMYKKTRYAINLLPLGGYVRIHGESPDDELTPDSILAKPKWQQALVLVAGVTFNIIFAWLILSLSLTFGTKTSTDGFPVDTVRDRSVMIDFVSAESPADTAGLKPGDELLAVSNKASSFSSSTLTISAVHNLIATTPASSTISVTYKENLETKTVVVTPKEGIVAGKPAIGISMSEIGIVQLNPFSALYYGAIQTYNLAIAIGTGLAKFIGSIFIGQANFKEISGPVGIAVVLGQASRTGFSYLITITAIISVNLAAINLVPFPALDGGRLLVVGIEAIIRRPLKASVVNAINIVGFGFLIILMLVVTFKDILKLFN